MGSNKFLNWGIVIVPVVAAVLMILPPQEKLKGGIDLVGGCSLLYEVDTTGLSRQETHGLAERVISVLQRRVDPNAQLNLVWRPIGNTRLEIQMPRPPKRALERRKAYDEALESLRALNVGRLDVEAALAADPAMRPQRIAELVHNVPQREQRLATLVEAYDKYQETRKGDDVDAEEAARAVYEAALDVVLQTSMPMGRVTDVLALSDEHMRSEQLGRLKAEFPGYDAALAKAGKQYKEWAGSKAALEDPSDLKRLIRGAGVLEFRILADRNLASPNTIETKEVTLQTKTISEYVDQLQQRGPRPRPGDHFRWFPVQDLTAFMNQDNLEDAERLAQAGKQIVSKYAGRWYVLAHADPQYGLLHEAKQRWKLTSAAFSRDESGRPAVSFTLDRRGGSQFLRLTKDNIGRQLTIVLDDMAMSHATIQSAIAEHGQITGQFTPQEVDELVKILEAGSLPGRLKDTPLMEKNIGPSLGQTNRVMGLRSAVYAFLAVIVFMGIYYRFAGVVANLAVVLNLLLVLGIMSQLQATFTLPGVAGLILTVGMAVDANVLIFERFREEREKGTAFKRALKAGYEKALSTIIDANLTTLITCVVLGYLGSEDVKGFAIVLGFGIVTSMFTALFVTRLIFTTLHDAGWLKDLKMFRLIRVPSVDWMGLRRMFFPASLACVLGGVVLFVTASEERPESVYDIEFLGGTSVQIELKEGVKLKDEEVRQRLTARSGEKPSAVQWLNLAADALAKSRLLPGASASQFAVESDTLSPAQIEALMLAKPRGVETTLADQLEPNGVHGEGNVCKFDIKPEVGMTMERFGQARTAAVDYARQAARLMAGARIQTVHDIGTEQAASTDTFEIVTVESNKQLVQEAILAAMREELAIELPIEFVPVTDAAHPEGYYPIEEDAIYLSDAVGGSANYDVRGYRGGVVLQFDQLDPPQTLENIKKRIREIRLQPDFASEKWRKYDVFGLTLDPSASAGGATGAAAAGEGGVYQKVAIVVVDEELPYYEDPQRWAEAVAAPELAQAAAALRSEKTLRKVVQFAPQVASQARNAAVLAVAVALAAIVAYVWIRFGTMDFGLAAIVALVHDVSITLGFITLSDFFHGGAIGDFLLIRDFKIDLPMIAALLTLIGYSLNDTIVVFDRIRETKGKLTSLTAPMINGSINQTMSRTILTGLTTWIVVVIMYFLGGPGIHGFAYALLMGIFVGTYSSIAVAAPLLYRPKALHVVVYVLVALGLFGIASVLTPNRLFLTVVGVLLAVVLTWAIYLEVKPAREHGRLAPAPA